VWHELTEIAAEIHRFSYHDCMVVRVHKVGDEFTFVLPPQAAEELHLVDGAAIDIRPAEAPADPIRYATVNEALEVHRKLERRYGPAYRELAK
jgi:hypothetical protein